MDININKIVSAKDFSMDVPAIREALKNLGEIIIFDDNKPQFIIKSIEESSIKLQQETTYEENHTSGKITLQMVREAYPIIKKVWNEEISRDRAKFEIEKKTGMNNGSAQALITIFLSMMKGEVYKRAFNNAGTQFLLESILADYGKEYFNSAMKATKAHAEYYSTLGKGRLRGLERLIDDLSDTYK